MWEGCSVGEERVYRGDSHAHPILLLCLVLRREERGTPRPAQIGHGVPARWGVTVRVCLSRQRASKVKKCRIRSPASRWISSVVNHGQALWNFNKKKNKNTHGEDRLMTTVTPAECEQGPAHCSGERGCCVRDPNETTYALLGSMSSMLPRPGLNQRRRETTSLAIHMNVEKLPVQWGDILRVAGP